MYNYVILSNYFDFWPSEKGGLWIKMSAIPKWSIKYFCPMSWIKALSLNLIRILIASFWTHCVQRHNYKNCVRNTYGPNCTQSGMLHKLKIYMNLLFYSFPRWIIQLYKSEIVNSWSCPPFNSQFGEFIKWWPETDDRLESSLFNFIILDTFACFRFEYWINRIASRVFMFHTLSLDMGNIQTLFQTQNNSTKLEVKGVTERKNTLKICISSRYKSDSVRKDVDH